MIKEFEVKIADEVLIDLKKRLENSRWIADNEAMAWQYGTNKSYLMDLVDYWQNAFSWREVEDKINSFPNYIATIDGFQVHFIHIRSKAERSIPLIITHGWPGSFWKCCTLFRCLQKIRLFLLILLFHPCRASVFFFANTTWVFFSHGGNLMEEIDEGVGL